MARNCKQCPQSSPKDIHGGKQEGTRTQHGQETSQNPSVIGGEKFINHDCHGDWLTISRIKRLPNLGREIIALLRKQGKEWIPVKKYFPSLTCPSTSALHGMAIKDTQTDNVTHGELSNGVKTFPNGVQTTMQVEMNSSNHLRFVDDPKPTDLVRDGRLPIKDKEETIPVLQTMENEVVEEDNGEDQDMLEDTYTMDGQT
ncbi:YjbQ family protein [Sesbania bispinosa]|nr:YjbQ family protein [Sesbania bispinosa]